MGHFVKLSAFIGASDVEVGEKIKWTLHDTYQNCHASNEVHGCTNL